MPFSNNLPNQPELLNWQQFAELFAEQTRRDCGAEVSIEWGEDLESTTLPSIWATNMPFIAKSPPIWKQSWPTTAK